MQPCDQKWASWFVLLIVPSISMSGEITSRESRRVELGFAVDADIVGLESDSLRFADDWPAVDCRWSDAKTLRIARTDASRSQLAVVDVVFSDAVKIETTLLPLPEQQADSPHRTLVMSGDGHWVMVVDRQEQEATDSPKMGVSFEDLASKRHYAQDPALDWVGEPQGFYPEVKKGDEEPAPAALFLTTSMTGKSELQICIGMRGIVKWWFGSLDLIWSVPLLSQEDLELPEGARRFFFLRDLTSFLILIECKDAMRLGSPDSSDRFIELPKSIDPASLHLDIGKRTLYFLNTDTAQLVAKDIASLEDPGTESSADRVILNGVKHIGWLSDDEFLVTSDSSFVLFNVSGEPLREFEPAPFEIAQLNVSTDGRLLAATDLDQHCLAFWDVTSGRRLRFRISLTQGAPIHVEEKRGMFSRMFGPSRREPRNARNGSAN